MNRIYEDLDIWKIQVFQFKYFKYFKYFNSKIQIPYGPEIFFFSGPTYNY